MSNKEKVYCTTCFWWNGDKRTGVSSECANPNSKTNKCLELNSNNDCRHFEVTVNTNNDLNQKKVYCKNCFYRYRQQKQTSGGIVKHDVCTHENSTVTIETYLEIKTAHGFCSTINSKNDCKFFTPLSSEKVLKLNKGDT